MISATKVPSANLPALVARASASFAVSESSASCFSSSASFWCSAEISFWLPSTELCTSPILALVVASLAAICSSTYFLDAHPVTARLATSNTTSAGETYFRILHLQ